MTIAPLKHDSAGLARWIEREALALPDYHWTRELLQNAIDAGATKVVFDPYEVGSRKLARCSDNGPGMTQDELLTHCLTLHKSGPGRRDNYGVGARLATLANNPAGVTWAARAEDRNLDDIADCLVMLRKERHQYGMEVWDFVDGTRGSVALPDEGMLDRIGDETGTAVILHGNGRTDSWSPQSSHAIDAYLTRRYCLFGSTNEVEVLVRHEFGPRRVLPYGEQLGRDQMAWGSVLVDDEGSIAHWWVLQSTPERKHARTRLVASISARAENELFDMVRATDPRARYGQFGIYTKSAKSRVAIVVEPGFKVQMTTSRNGLTRAGGKDLPWVEWGNSFYEQMPEEIAALMSSHIGFAQLDERWLKDLGKEWLKLINATPVQVPDLDGELEGLLERKQIATGGREGGGGGGVIGPLRPPRPRTLGHDDGEARGKNKDTHTLPKFDFMDDEQWDGGDTKFAYYNRTVNTVFIRKEAFLFDAATSRFTQEFPLVNSSILKDYVLNGYGTEAVAKVVHVLSMEKHGWTIEEVERALGPDGLSAALLGMHSIDRFIRDRCRDLVSGRSSE